MGFVYIRDNNWYKREDVLKMGIATDIKARNSTYITGEVNRGVFIKIFSVPDQSLIIIDKCLKRYFKKYQIYKGGGTEFYNRDIVNLITPYLLSMNGVTEIDINEINNESKNKAGRLILKYMKMKRRIIPRDYQQIAIKAMEEYYKTKSIGHIKWACGLGKALLGLFYVQKMQYKNVIIGVPSVYLQQQMAKSVEQVFNIKPLLIGGTSENIIKRAAITITTYHSCKLLQDQEYDFKIADEAHHLIGSIEDAKMFRLFHNIKASKTLFMSATLPVHIPEFGSCINELTTKWAIINRKITDYNIIISVSTERYNNLYLSCICALNALKTGKLTHILLYTNNIEDALRASKYIDHIINTDGRYKVHKFIYNNCLHSRSACNVKDELEKFKKSQFSIISCVYLFGEGFDMPELNGVCIAANMHSETRIIQYLLRPNRLNPLLPSKRASIILPLQRNEENILTSNIVQIIREFSDADPGVLNKIIINCEDQTQINIINAEVMITLAKGGILNYSIEEAEYKRAKAINLTYNIQSKYKYSREYEKLKLPEFPDIYYKKLGVWRGWLDFFNDNNLYVSKDEWRQICQSQSLTIYNYNSEYKKYNLPPDPEEYYNGFTNINNELQLTPPRRSNMRLTE